MKFQVKYIVGKKRYRTKIITANSLDHAEEICNKTIPKWTDIVNMKTEQGKRREVW